MNVQLMEPVSSVAHDELLPSQKAALRDIENSLGMASVVAFAGPAGMGKTRVARLLAERHGADYLCLADYLATVRQMPHDRWDERVFRMVEARLRAADMIILDDFTYLKTVCPSPRGTSYSEQSIDELRLLAERLQKKLVLVGRSRRPEDEFGPYNPDQELANWVYEGGRTPVVLLGPALEAEDFAALAAACLGESRAAAIDFSVVQHYAAHLSLRQIQLVCSLIADVAQPDTRLFVEQLGIHVLRDNMRLADVEVLDFASLPGSESIAEALETHVVMPFEHPELARRNGVSARRGVMLFGPPGTGKTSIGRALARRMKGKFFLIDGSIGTEPPNIFMTRIKGIIEQAVKSAPSVLFIDDADTLFAIPYVGGLVRYLLTLLDGLESENASKVCVMMTVMDAQKVPDALVRSGRVELWLEMSPPDEPTRARILARWAGSGLPETEQLDFARLAALSAGFTPADLRRVMDDARLLYARDLAVGRSARSATDYAEQAITELRRVRERMASLLGDAKLPGALKNGGLPA